MFIESARLIRERLAGASCKLIANVGSSSWQYYSIDKPFIWTEILAPLKERGCVVMNIDIKDEMGINFQHDMESDEDVPLLGLCDVVLCTQMLEHVRSPEKVLHNIRLMLKPDGFMVLDIPGEYPYHEDPIDTGMRIRSEQEMRALVEPYGFIITEYHMVTAPRGSSALALCRKA